ncbi:ribosomal protection-like ABC-F family protein [Amphibacillus cookii]|uniref:ribosomal protection-like ABC-F family protein n=1 Tax=Amphibacillus cookii TaxID=767787 RepID=UPI00195DEA6A|nr:ABC-F type ribosomal protection protein [Amphibacillus cookii]
MAVIELVNIKQETDGKPLFEIDHLQIKKHARIGLVGRNGSGKSTLLALIAGQMELGHGEIKRFGSVQLLPQLKTTETTESGGEVTQRYIDNALAQKTDVLLADEPSTNLDHQHIEKLMKQLKRWHGALILVAHDRALLDALCDEIWEINQQKLSVYVGNYSNYRKRKEQEVAEQEAAYQQYLEKKKQLERAQMLKQQKAERATKKPKQLSHSEAKITGAKPYFAKKQKKLQQTKKALETRLSQLEKVDKPYQTRAIKMDLPDAKGIHQRPIIRVTNLAGQIENKMLWQPASFQIKGGDHVAIIGANGAGKTTLIHMIINQVHGVENSSAIKIGYFHQKLNTLDLHASILTNVSKGAIQSETLIRTLLARLHFFEDDVNKPVSVLSGGERVKVVLAQLMVSDINTLILDEPTNFLDLETVEALETLLADFPGTLLFVSHDQWFIERLATKLIVIENQTLKLFPGTYRQFKAHDHQHDQQANDLMIIETRLSEVLSKLSLNPSDELEQEFQALLKQKQQRLNK